MMRWDIINHLIKQNNYKSYLEIGYYKGWSFDRIKGVTRTAVDPNPSKYPEWETLPYGATIEDSERQVIIKETSDDFFARLTNQSWDIIFIDGLHKSEQVDRDVQNALKYLNPGGTIVMHDCNPTTEEMTTTGTQAGEWTGDVYKSFIRAKNRLNRTHIMFVVDTDYGVGIIQERENPIGAEISIMWSHKETETWEEFDSNRRLLLTLISPEEFLKIETHAETIPG